MKYAIAAALLLPLAAGANDSVGGVGVGGIVLRKTDAIAMKKEVLNVSRALITVDYEFLNETAADVEETIVFPLPAYHAAGHMWHTYYGRPRGFSIEVDGKTVPYQTVVRALLNGADITPQLRKLGLSDAQIVYHYEFDDEVKAKPLSAAQRQQLEKLKLFGESEEDGEMGPLWEVQVNYVWQQKFPSNKVVRVHHAYRPFISGGPGEWHWDDKTAKRYCADAAFLKSWKKAALKGGIDSNSDYLPANKVAYILKSGNNWKNGIEDFTLNLIKVEPTELVSLCFPGTFKKIDARTLQVRLRNFRPERDLDVYFGNIQEDFHDNEGRIPVPNK